MQVNLTEQQWQQVMAGVSLLPWRDANPLLIEMTRQLQNQNVPIVSPKGDGKEVEREQPDPDAITTSH